MRVPRSTERRGDRFDSTMTPMIDVIFQLMIFFVCTSSFERLERSLPTDLSASGSVATVNPVEPPPTDLQHVVVRVVRIEDQVVWNINGEVHRDEASVRRVLAGMAHVANDIPVILDVAGDIPLGYAVRVYDWCRVAGCAKVHFAASLDTPGN